LGLHQTGSSARIAELFENQGPLCFQLFCYSVREGEVFNILVWIFEIDAGHVIAMFRMSVVITLWDVLGSFVVEVNLKIIPKRFL